MNSDANQKDKTPKQTKKATYRVLGLALVFISTLALAQNSESRQIQISARDLRNGSAAVLGDLGVPLGTPVEVEGFVVLAKSVRRVSLTDEYLLVIDTVNGKKLNSTKTYSFWLESSTQSLMANTELGLKMLLEGLAGEYDISREQADKLMLDYTKVRRKLLVFESAVYSGRPLNLPATAPQTSAPAFGFETYLVVVEPGK